MKKKMSKKTILLIVGIILLFSITLGSAILSSLLSIEGNTTIKENSWIIYFDSVRKSSDSVESSNDAKITNYEKTRIDFSANLKEPGDFYEFTVYTVNDGTIDAMVDSVEKFELTEDQQKYLDFSVTYDNGRQIKRCDPLDAGTRKRIKAIVKFKDGIDLSNYSTEDVNLDLYFDIHYVQKDDACPSDPTGNEHILTLRPHGGTYKKRTDETRIYIEPGQTYEIEDPTRYLYNFTGWEKVLPETEGTYTLENNIFTMGNEDVTLEAQWEEGAYVARIMNKYYTSIQEAFDAVDTKDWEDNTVYLLKNQNEDPINNSTNPFVFNLGGYTVTGRLINQKEGTISLVNGKIIAESDQPEAAINYGTITLGAQGGGVQVENSIALIGNEVGLRNVNKVGNYGNFYFYDGYIEAVAALVGGYSGVEEGYFIFSEHIPERNDQRVYLVRNPNRAVAKTTTDGVIYYYNLQDAINQASINKKAGELPDTDYVISAVRNFEAAYKVKVKNDETIIIDLDGHTVSTGDTVTNNGNFTIKNTSQTAATLKPSRTFTNTSNLDISNIAVRSSADENTFNNSGNLKLNKVTIQAKAGYGINNTNNGTIALDENTIIASTNIYGIHNTASNLVLNNGTIYGIENTNKLTLTGNVNPISTKNTINPIYNSGTLNIENLNHTDTYSGDYIYNYNGTITVNGGKLQNSKNVINGYYGSVVLNDVDIKSTNSSAISGSYINTTLNSGKVESNSSAAISCSSLTMNDGEVTGKGNGIDVSNLTLVNGSISSDATGAYASSANIQGGTITGVTYGLSSNSLTLSNGTITATEGIGINTSSANISGGVVNGITYGVKTNSINMTNGNVTATNGVGILLNTEGTITGGTIFGETYGVQAKNKIILGTNDETISSISPVITGNLYGLYSEGNDINFYDGILKGQTDGYYGKITGLPTGGLVVDGTETINDILYQTDTVNAYRNWLQVGDEQFNNIDSACEAITDEGTITVIDDVDVRFIQNFIKNNNVDREITFDLNGHIITTTQPIYNHTNVTIIDSSNEKTGKVIANRVKGIVNETDGTITIDAGIYETTTANVPIENRNRMTINYAKTISNTLGLRNYGYLTINDASIEGSVTGIENNANSNVYPNCGTRGYIVINGGTISATDTAITKGSGTIEVNDGYVYGTNYGIGDSSGNVTVNGGLVKAKNNNALYTYSGTLKVTDGQVISENNIAMLSHADMYVEGGYVEGTKGIQNEQYCSSLSCWYNNTYVSDGHIVGKTEEGINYKGDSSGQLVITGGTVEGQTNGVTTTAKVRIGTNDESVSITTPVLIGHTTYGIKHTNYTEFYDGILKGIVDGRNGLVGIIPDGYLIKDDYEYIDRVEYQTDYLVEKGNWLRVGNKEFNSINKAKQYITEENNTMTVIADAYVDFAQTINSQYDIVFDFNGHSLIMTQPLQVNSNTKFINTREVGGINNLRDTVMTISGANVVIEAGIYHSDTTTAIVNSGTLTVNDGEIKADYNYAISTSGTTIINGGLIRGDNQANAITNSGALTVNGGTIYSVNKTGISTSSTRTTINNGTITSEKNNAISIWDSTLEINNGIITSNESVAITTSNSYYGSAYVTINNGEITGHTTGINVGNDSGTFTLNDGHIVGTTGTGVVTYPTSHINGGNLEGGQYGLRVASSSKITYIGNNDGTINIDAPSIKGDLYGLYTDSSNTVHFYDGIIKGITGRHSGVINTIATRSQIFEDEEDINGLTYQTEYLVTETEIVINENTRETYGNLQEAITQAQTGETLRLLTNVPLYYEIAVINNPNITLNMDGYIISTNKPWRITVPFTITNTNENEASMKISTAVNLITTTDNLTINNVTLKNTSSSNYVVNNTGKLNLNGVKVDCINGIQNSNELSIVNGTINATGNTISNTGKMTITGGTYTGENYSLYSNSSKTVTIAYATFNGVTYNSGNNTASISDSQINGNLQNNTSNLTMYRSNINTGRVTNSGILTMNDSTFTATTTQYDYYYYNDIAMSNTGTLTLNHSNVMINKQEIGKSSTAIHNTGELNINNDSKVYIGLENNNYTYRGIYTTSNGLTTIENSEVKVTGGTTNYGLYIDGANAKAVVLTGAVKTELASTSYGVYIDKGTFEMGHYEGQGVEADDVSTTNPLVQSEAKSRGIGVKKINASFNFYDGKIRASKYAKPETTTNVEYQFEVTTYVENDTGYEYAILEWMRNDYQGDTVCLLNDVYYKSVQDAIDKANAGDEIVLLKSIEENLTIPTNKNIKLNLNQHSITTKVTNNGTFNVYNGSLQSFDDTTIINRGTLILGEDDNTVSSSNIRIVSESTTIQSTGTIIMYDGYIEGTEAIDGKINQIAQYSRVRTVHDEQSEKKFIQSLSPEAIQNGETDLIITIDPNSGLYEESKEVKEIFKKYHETYTLSTPTKRGCNFIGWELSEDAVYDEQTNTITVDISDVTATAKWEVSSDAVAKVGEEYYLSLQEALDNASEGDTVELLKNTTEDITNKSNVKLDLGGYKVTGAFINQGELRIINGTIENPDGVGMINQKLLTMGENDGEIHEDSVQIIGTTIGLQQDARFRFYDGFIEGDIALYGRVDAVPQGYFLYNDRNNVKNCQRVYLIGNPANAVAIIDNGGTQYFFSLQSAIDTAVISGDEIYIARSFEAAYPITVPEGADITINMNSYNITTGNEITNNGTLRIYDVSEEDASITTARPIVNNGTLTIDGMKIKQNTANDAITNNGTLNINGATIESASYAVRTNGPMTMNGNSKVIRTDGGYAIYNNYDGLTLESGETSGIYNAKTLTIGGDFAIKSTHNNSACVHTTTANAKLIMNSGTCTAENIGISMQGSGERFELNSGSITAKKQGLYVNNTSGSNTTIIEDGSIVSTSHYGIYYYGNAHNLTINDGLIKSNTSTAIWIDSWSSSDSQKYNVTINGGEIDGGDYGAVFYYTKLDINGGTFTTRSTNRDRYAIWYYYGKNSTIKNATLNADNASGMYVRAYSHTLEDVVIESNASSGYGIYMEESTVDIKSGTTVNANGLSSTGVMFSSNSNAHTLNINGGEIKSANVGIDTYTTNSTRTINVNSGKVTGNTYGINLRSSSATVNIGNTSDDLSIEQPIVSGGLYGVYKTAGTLNFYNGVLRGHTYGYSDSVNRVRKSKEITAEEEDSRDEEKIATYTTTEISQAATSNIAKIGNGYARITYIGDDVVCPYGQSWDFDYIGSESIFTPLCSGKYKLEVWGAQGGNGQESSNSIGGYGGYATGEITLNTQETLYINVGGQGESNTNQTGISLGGYNGGGRGYRAGGGGGATHIATKSGLLSTLKNDKNSVIIVAGAGGGGAASRYSSTSRGGSGGGYIGENGYKEGNLCSGSGDNRCAIAGNQTAGGYTTYGDGNATYRGKFGAGGDAAYFTVGGAGAMGGGGAGWYGGSGTYDSDSDLDSGGGAGGSGYLGSSRLSNVSMYGYNVPVTQYSWIKNYLIDKDKFLQVNEEEFNSIDNAVAYIIENLNGTGTIKVIKNATIEEDSTIPENTNITLDLNGKTLTLTRSITNKSNLTIIDSTEEKAGKITSTKTNIVINQLNLHIVNGTFETPNNTVIMGNTNEGTITIDEGVTLTGYAGINTSTKYTIILDHVTINATTSTAVVSSGSSSNITITDSTITSRDASGVSVTGASSVINLQGDTITAKVDAVVPNTSPYTLTISDCTINGTSSAVALYGNRGTVNISNSSITGNSYGVYIYSYNMNMTLTGNTIKCNNGVGIHDTYNGSSNNVLNLTGGTVEGATHGLYTYYTSVTTSDVTIKTNSTNIDQYAFYTNYNSPTIIFNDGTKLFAPSASGLRNATNTTINDVEITANATNSYGIANVENGNLKIYNGTINSGKYGIYQNNANATTTIGKSDEELSIDVPLIIGTQYGFYKTAGKSNFYSGRLKGNTESYHGEFNKVRRAHKVYTFDEVIDEEQPDETRKVSYLTETEAFLQVGDDPENVFNTFEDAIAATNATDTITVLNDNMVYDNVEFPAGKNITLNLNNHDLITTQQMVNKGTLTIIGGDDSTKNKISNSQSEGISNKGTLTLEDISFTTSGVTIRATEGTNPITITNSKIKGSSPIRIDVNQLLTVTNSEVEATSGHAIYQNASNQKTIVTSSKIKSKDVGIYMSYSGCKLEVTDSSINSETTGVYQNTSNQNLTVESSNISGTTYGIYSYGSRNVVNISNKTKINGGDIGIYQNHNLSSDYATFTIDDATITGTNYGIYIRGALLTTTNTKINVTITSRDRYAAVCEAYARCNFSDNTSLNAPNASGIYVNTNYTVNLENTTIESELSNSYGIYAYDGTININAGTKINVSGYQSYGIYQSHYDAITNVNSGEIHSGNIGAFVGCERNDAKKLNVNKGKIVGEVYGISTTCTNNTVTIGNLNDEVSITDPYIEGGLISINKSAGILNFYSGLLKGYVRGNPGTVDGVRTGYEIFDDEDEAQVYIRAQKTISTTDHSETAIENNSKEGNGYARITYEEYEDIGDNYTDNPNIVTEIGTEFQNNIGENAEVKETYDFDYSGTVQTFEVEQTGVYRLKVWGAEGGPHNGNIGGYGGYSYGDVVLYSGDTLYIYAGGKGKSNAGSITAFNGGAGTTNGSSASGGGASDIRINQDSLYARLIVAGGGGGAGAEKAGGFTYGYGGGLTGGYGAPSGYPTANPGTQNNGGAQVTSGGFIGYAGTFGIGGKGFGNTGGGGGGGWYGGGGAIHVIGAGGSGYVYTNESSDYYPTGCLLDERYYMENAETIAGNSSFESPSGSIETGHTGNGYVRIELLGGFDTNEDTHTIELISDIGTIENNILTYNDGDVLGNIPQPVVNDNNIQFEGWYTNKKYKNKVTADTIVNMSTTLYAKFSHKDTYCQSVEGTLVKNFDYTGKDTLYIIPCPGKYKVEVWGAQGGNTAYNSYSNTGGYGGYTVGHIKFKQNENIYVVVGGQGNSINYQQSTGTATYDSNTGYNGGGYAGYYTNNSAHAGGGGATHIATKRGVLSSLSNVKNEVLIVAGGGGGASTHSSYPSYSGDGGSGGGAVAGSGITSNTTCYNYGTGGTQNTGGSFVSCTSDGRTSRDSAPETAKFGEGSNYKSNSSSVTYSGGGAGWYGGQSGWHAPGGGGSGYLSQQRVEEGTMYGYNIEEAYVDNKSNIAYLIEKRELIKNLSTDETYLSLQDAIDEANQDETLQYISNDYMSSNVEIPLGKHIIIDLNGFNIVTSKTITNNGVLTIENTNEEYTSKITNNASVTEIVNNGTLTLDNIKMDVYNGIDSKENATLNIDESDINARNNGITNAGKMTIEASTIYGATYDIYSNSAKTELISNTTLKASSNGYYKYNNGDTTITDSAIKATINNSRTGQPLEVKDSVITSYIRNTGNSIYTNNEIKTTMPNDSTTLIYNTGTLTLEKNDIEYKTNTTNGSYYSNTILENRGTAISNNNDYMMEFNYNGANTYNNRYRYLYLVQNYGLLTSTYDEYISRGAYELYGIYNNSSNASTLSNATITSYYGSNQIRGIHNEAGNITIDNTSIEIYDANRLYGTYIKNGTVEENNTNKNVHNGYNHSDYSSYGTYLENGTYTQNGGNITVSNVYNGYGTFVSKGTYNFKNGHMEIFNNTNSYGVYLNNSSVVYTQGIYDGRGTEDSDVSENSPYISAIGTTTGIGVRMGGGTFNYYDGYILGSTSPRQSGDITTSTELNYQVITKQDENTGYNYCILEYNK